MIDRPKIRRIADRLEKLDSDLRALIGEKIDATRELLADFPAGLPDVREALESLTLADAALADGEL
ncbi:MAG: hypothetical protein AB7P12_16315, partial [Alphaproteobacteria bacterium]